MNARVRQGNDYGILSVWFGSIAIGALITAQQVKLIWDPDPRLGHFLRWMDSYGLVRTSSKKQAEVASSGLITFTDESFLLLLTYFGSYLAITTIFFSLVAEYRSEDNLYLSVGFILGALGLLLLSPPIGVTAMVIGALVVQLIRHKRQRTSS